MNRDENTEVKLFGFRINNTIAVVIIFMVIPLIIGNFYPFFIFIYSLIQQIGSQFMGAFSIVINYLINILIILVSVTIYTYILIVCSKTKNLQRETEYNQMSWFGFKLTRTSSITIGILSILGIITVAISFISYFNSLINMVSLLLVLPTIIIVQYILNAIGSLALILMYIYTIIVCRKANLVLIDSKSA